MSDALRFALAIFLCLLEYHILYTIKTNKNEKIKCYWIPPYISDTIALLIVGLIIIIVVVVPTIIDEYIQYETIVVSLFSILIFSMLTFLTTCIYHKSKEFS